MNPQKKQRTFRAIYEAQLMRPPKGASGRNARTFPVMARALRDLPERWLPEGEGQIWVWSDLHLGHENIIRFRDRPFRDAGHMDNALLDNWAETVDWAAENDAIVVCGEHRQEGRSIVNSKPISSSYSRLARAKVSGAGKSPISAPPDEFLRVEAIKKACSMLFADGNLRS